MQAVAPPSRITYQARHGSLTAVQFPQVEADREIPKRIQRSTRMMRKRMVRSTIYGREDDGDVIDVMVRMKDDEDEEEEEST
ncbi:hypothetical protein Tco_0633886 [Tanacetum coccineum]